MDFKWERRKRLASKDTWLHVAIIPQSPVARLRAAPSPKIPKNKTLKYYSPFITYYLCFCKKHKWLRFLHLCLWDWKLSLIANNYSHGIDILLYNLESLQFPPLSFVLNIKSIGEYMSLKTNQQDFSMWFKVQQKLEVVQIYMITESGANVRREWHSELPSKRIKIIKLYGSGKAKFR